MPLTLTSPTAISINVNLIVAWTLKQSLNPQAAFEFVRTDENVLTFHKSASINCVCEWTAVYCVLVFFARVGAAAKKQNHQLKKCQLDKNTLTFFPYFLSEMIGYRHQNESLRSRRQSHVRLLYAQPAANGSVNVRVWEMSILCACTTNMHTCTNIHTCT